MPSSSPRQLTRRYLASLLLVVLVGTVAATSIRQLGTLAQRDLDNVGAVATQRSLVQRGAVLAARLPTTSSFTDQEAIQHELGRTAADLEANHLQITRGHRTWLLEQWPPPAVRTVMSDEPHRLEARVVAYVGTLRDLAGESDGVILPTDGRLASVREAADGPLPRALDAALFAAKVQTLRDVQRVERFALLLGGGALVLLLIDAAVVFLPLARRQANQTEQLARVNRQLQLVSGLDGLTGLLNRRRLTEVLRGEWMRAARKSEPVSVLMIDVDHFKAYNDRHGHPEGDRCLRQVASAVRACVLRGTDHVARYGGEEFCVVLPDTGPEGAEIVAERIRTQISGLAIPHGASGVSQVVTVSIGAAVTMPVPASTHIGLVEAADRALYQSKSGGRNRTTLHEVVTDPVDLRDASPEGEDVGTG